MKREWPIAPGKIVRSKAGRDENRYFVVIALAGDFAYIADGDTHRIEKPKKKRVKHLFVTEGMVSGLQGKLEAGEQIENFELRGALTAYRQKEE